ncbi:PREDICTED: myosin-M heavy chain-like [Acropora digitifera]|uniref:myosin-M heavy chain-like n=1 Tax=Acropora digitifera TaxID=70779 RepID=UPI00077AFD91|nr:PREDICTED: myosin-M heavy chain-like [Acropora digitifera]
MWYLVIYEDDGNLRVLAEDEIRPIFPDEDEDEEVQIGDIVSALWIPNGKYYDAKVVQIGADRNVLMKGRMRLEKAKKNEGKETGKEAPKVQQKRKNLESPGDGQKKKKTGSQVRSTKGSEQKEMEKEEKKKKKEEEQTRQKFVLEARKAQAALRWTPSQPNQEEGVEIVSPQNGIFRPKPLRRTSESSTTNRLTPSEPDVTVVSPQFSVSTSDPIHRSSPSSPCLTPPAHETVPARINTGNAVCTLESVHRTSPPSTTRPTPARINAVTSNAF